MNSTIWKLKHIKSAYQLMCWLAKGWYKLADDEQVVKKAVLSKEEAEWFEKYKDLPFYDLPLYADDSSNHFTKKSSNKMVQYRED